MLSAKRATSSRIRLACSMSCGLAPVTTAKWRACGCQRRACSTVPAVSYTTGTPTTPRQRLERRDQRLRGGDVDHGGSREELRAMHEQLDRRRSRPRGSRQADCCCTCRAGRSRTSARTRPLLNRGRSRNSAYSSIGRSALLAAATSGSARSTSTAAGRSRVSRRARGRSCCPRQTHCPRQAALPVRSRASAACPPRREIATTRRLSHFGAYVLGLGEAYGFLVTTFVPDAGVCRRENTVQLFRSSTARVSWRSESSCF